MIMAFFKIVKPIKWAALVAAVLLHGPLYAAPMESAQDLMARMAKASRELNYQRPVLPMSTAATSPASKSAHGSVRRPDRMSAYPAYGWRSTGGWLSRIGQFRLVCAPAICCCVAVPTRSRMSRAMRVWKTIYDFHIKGDGRIANRDVANGPCVAQR